jgi:hypothetical protein
VVTAGHGEARPRRDEHEERATTPGPDVVGPRLSRCAACGELWGGSYLCLCDGLVCAACGQGRIRRPISDYSGEATREIIHTPHFAVLRPVALVAHDHTGNRPTQKRVVDLAHANGRNWGPPRFSETTAVALISEVRGCALADP